MIEDIIISYHYFGFKRAEKMGIPRQTFRKRCNQTPLIMQEMPSVPSPAPINLSYLHTTVREMRRLRVHHVFSLGLSFAHCRASGFESLAGTKAAVSFMLVLCVELVVASDSSSV